jgi:hypothetical protein
MSKYTTYHLRTIKGILSVITEDNVDAFLKDFELWLKLHLHVETMNKVAKTNGLGRVETQDEEFTWIDDGKHDMHVNLDVSVKNKHGDK